MPRAQSTTFMFSGQGSHYYQMGRDLFATDRIFRTWLGDLDTVARDAIGTSVIAAMYDHARRKGDPFDRLELTHPAIFMVEVALAHTLIARGIVPACALGVSLGAFAAATIAGCLEPETALRAVIAQARIIRAHCRPGGMIAVLASVSTCNRHVLSGACEIAAVNGAAHFVVAAPANRLPEIEAHFRRTQVSFQRLPVAYAFHSKWIDEARGALEADMRAVPVKPARLPLACCALAAQLTAIPDDYFWQVVRRPIRFQEIIEMLERSGGQRFVDAGPAGSLAAVLKQMLPKTSVSTVRAIMSPFGGDTRAVELLAGS